MITLVLGGARSGKSLVAERLAAQLSPPLSYLATAVVTDSDHEARIATHRARRDPAWATIETGADLTAILRDITGSVLIDSLGTWVAAHEQFAVDLAGLCGALAERAGDTVIVSEEVGLGVHPSSESGRLFRDALGGVNATIAEVADDVVLVIAGRVLPLRRA